MNLYAEESEMLAILARQIAPDGRVNGLFEHRGRTACVLVLLRNPLLQTPAPRKVI